MGAVWTGRLSALAVVALVLSGCGNAPEVADTNPRLRASRTPALSTSQADLTTGIARLRQRLEQAPDDVGASVSLADLLLRQTRVTNSAAPAEEARRLLTAHLVRDPDHYEARRMLASVYLSQHLFGEAIVEARRSLAIRNDDDFVFGVLGDAYIELGDYPKAFDAFDTMNRLKPTASSYARASYARELAGDLPGAVTFMHMALEATPPTDTESLAWHHAQIGHLHYEQGDLANAAREYAHAAHVFPDHPFAIDGLARVEAASGRYQRALDLVLPRLSRAPMPADLALAGDLFLAWGRHDDAERHYRLAEAAWLSDVPEPTRLARFLAERGRKIDVALKMAEAAYTERRDIFTADAVAWAALQTGQLDKARAAIADARRTGTRDRTILYHAAEIELASGRRDRARTLVAAAVSGAPRFDLVTARAARKLQASLSASAGAAQ